MSSPNLTPRQIALMMAVIAQLDSVQVDWNQVAAQANFSTGKYARDTWAGVKAKIKADTASNGTAATPTTKTKTTKKRKAKDITPADDGDAEVAEEEQIPKAKGKKKGSKKAAKEEKAADDDDDLDLEFE